MVMLLANNRLARLTLGQGVPLIVWRSVHITILTLPNLISTDLISSELIGSEASQFAVAATNHKGRHWIHCRGLRDLLRSDWSQPRRTESLHNRSIQMKLVACDYVRW